MELKNINWKQIIIALTIIAIGLFIINQFMDFKYKVQFLEGACNLCESYGNICQKGERLPVGELLQESVRN